MRDLFHYVLRQHSMVTFHSTYIMTCIYKHAREVNSSSSLLSMITGQRLLEGGTEHDAEVCETLWIRILCLTSRYIKSWKHAAAGH